MPGPRVDSPLPMAREFYLRLLALPGAPSIQRAFDRLFGAAAYRPALPAPGLRPVLYRALVECLLDGLDLPRTAGGLAWEWRPLLLLDAEVDPFYFSPQHLERRLAECPPLRPDQRNALVRVLTGYLELRRSGVLERMAPLLDPAQQARWTALFPAGLTATGAFGAAAPWTGLNALRGAGLHPLGSAAGWRSYRRFVAGEFHAPLNFAALIAWQQACFDALDAPGTAARAGGGEPDQVDAENAAAHQVDFFAAAFSGELTALGLDGPCGERPRCDGCALRAECAWARGKAPAHSGAEVAARARLSQLDAMPLESLLESLFALSPAGRERLALLLDGAPLRTLATKSAAELAEWQSQRAAAGAGLPTPAQWLVLFEVCRRFGEERLDPGAAFVQARDVFRHFRLRFRDLKQERFLVVLLDTKKRYLSDAMVTQGGLNSSPVHAREVFAAAMRDRAAFVLLVHNHPSGDPAPSPDDLAVTRELAEVGKIMGIPVLDHVILGDGRYVSMREEGMVDL
jgi:DNA repair protein RadC